MEHATMSLAPLLQASGLIPLHAVAAIAALVLGVVQLVAPKGTLPHRTIGWMGAADGDRGHQRVLDPRDPPVRAVQPDPPAVDLRAGHAVHRGALRAPAQCPPPQDNDDVDFLRRADRRRRLHVPAGADHAQRGFRSLNWPSPMGEQGSAGHHEIPVPKTLSNRLMSPGKSMKKRAEKPPSWASRGWRFQPRYAI